MASFGCPSLRVHGFDCSLRFSHTNYPAPSQICVMVRVMAYAARTSATNRHNSTTHIPWHVLPASGEVKQNLWSGGVHHKYKTLQTSSLMAQRKEEVGGERESGVDREACLMAWHLDAELLRKANSRLLDGGTRTE